jgi:hypothetical protein
MNVWRGTGFRLVALLLTTIVCADATLDAACDPIRLLGAETSVVATDAPASDPCAASCIPDCFCCSRSETAGPMLALPTPALLRQTAPATTDSITAGIRPVSERPPLTLS